MEERQPNLLMICAKAIWVAISAVFIMAVLCNFLSNLAGPIFVVDTISAEYKALVHSTLDDILGVFGVAVPKFILDVVTLISFSTVIALNIGQVRIMLIIQAALKSITFFRKSLGIVGQALSLLIIAAVLFRLVLNIFS